ncbi:MAG: efflux RND transporter periplasmic adaptor subunit [Betaproteobacteria bacterium]|nr:efflux RND transporter periplasmic adaptor subunit [Betaproteobacteria bacterium]
MLRNHAVLLGSALVAALAGACRDTASPPPALTPVRVQAAASAQGASALRYAATLQPVTQVNVSFKVGGYIESILQVRGVGGQPRDVQEGDRVARDAVLAVVRQNDYKVQVSSAQSQLASAQAVLDKAQRDYARAEKLYAAQAMTRPDYDSAVESLKTAQASVTAAQEQVASARIPLGDTSLRAPLDAVVLSRKIDVGTFVQPGTVGFVVASAGPVKVVFSVPDDVMRTLRIGQELAVIFPSSIADPVRKGPITTISPAADTQTRVFQVEITLPNPQGDLQLGMIGTVEVGDKRPPSDHPAVPLSAVVRVAPGAKEYAVFVVEGADGKEIARRRPVALGGVIGNRIVVESGLRPGERVIVSGAQFVVDGRPVRVLQ